MHALWMLLVVSGCCGSISDQFNAHNHAHNHATFNTACSPPICQVKTYRAPAFLATHYVNAFETDNGRFLHLDCAVTDSPALLSHWELNTGGDVPPPAKADANRR